LENKIEALLPHFVRQNCLQEAKIEELQPHFVRQDCLLEDTIKMADDMKFPEKNLESQIKELRSMPKANENTIIFTLSDYPQ